MYTLQLQQSIINFIIYPEIMNESTFNPCWNHKKCCICGSISCFESVDHIRLEISQLNELIQQTKCNRQCIDEIKSKIDGTYQSIQCSFLRKLESDRKAFQQWINQFYYPHLQGKVNISLLSQLSEHNYEQLPTKALSKMVKVIKNNANPKFT